MLTGAGARAGIGLTVGIGVVSVASLAAGLGLWVESPALLVSGPLLAVMLGLEWRRWRRRVARRRAQAALPQVVDRLVQQLRAGHSLAGSCSRLDQPDGDESAGRPASLPVDSLAPALRSGTPLLEAAGSLTSVTDHGTRLLGVTLVVLAANGGPAVPALQRLRHTLMAVVHGRQRTEAEASQALASAALLVSAPALFAVVVAAMDSGAAALYLFEPLGAVCIATALVLSWLGWCWMHRMVRASTEAVP